jgi:hypothetical protein
VHFGAKPVNLDSSERPLIRPSATFSLKGRRAIETSLASPFSP